MRLLPEEVFNLITKTLIPAFVAVSISVAVVMKKNGRISLLNIFLSYVIGIGFAYLFGSLIHGYFEQGLSTAIIGLIAISGEKIGNWFVFKFRVDDFLTGISNAIYEKIKSFL